MPKHQNHSGEHTDFLKSEVNCVIPVITARNQPSQPLQARANTKRRRKHRRRKSQPPPQPLQAEAKAEASKSQGNQSNHQPQPPQPPLGGAEKAQADTKAESKQAKARRRRAERKRTPAVDANKPVSPRNKKECDQAEVKIHTNTQAKRLRADSPQEDN